jgi:hypothetical protein
MQLASCWVREKECYELQHNTPLINMTYRNDDVLRMCSKVICGWCLLGNTVCSCEDPLCANERTTTEVLVQWVDQRHLPTPLCWVAILPTHNATLPVPATSRPLHTTHILAVHSWTGRCGTAKWRTWGKNKCYFSTHYSLLSTVCGAIPYFSMDWGLDMQATSLLFRSILI